MDPEKVDNVLAWKVPTNRDLLHGFIGSVGFLADEILNIHLPLGILSSVTGDKVPFRWTHTEQRVFKEAKDLVHAARNYSHRPISYGAIFGSSLTKIFTPGSFAFNALFTSCS